MLKDSLNDLKLLNLILEDDERAQSQFSATARWATYSSDFLGFLKETGLKDFRRTRAQRGEAAHVLASFGAVDLNVTGDLPGSSPEELLHQARTCFTGKSAKRIDDLFPSKVGNPEGFEIEGRFYTLSWLNFYCRYAYVSRFVDFDSDPVIVEVGPGSGKQAEMIKKAHPGATLVLFDLPTQLYVCHQYLSSVFVDTDWVVDYRAGRKVESFSDIQKGKINILPHWKFSIVENASFDLFWNAASLQEMGLETALSYLSAASNAEALFLMHNIKYRGMSRFPGERGAISEKYILGHEEVDRETAKLAWAPRTWLYFDSFWQRRL